MDDISVHTVTSLTSTVAEDAPAFTNAAPTDDDLDSVESDMDSIYSYVDKFGPQPGSILDNYNRAPPSPCGVDALPGVHIIISAHLDDALPSNLDPNIAAFAENGLSLLPLRGKVRVCSVSPAGTNKAWKIPHKLDNSGLSDPGANICMKNRLHLLLNVRSR